MVNGSKFTVKLALLASVLQFFSYSPAVASRTEQPYPSTSGRFIIHCQPTNRGELDPITKSPDTHRHDFFGPVVINSKMSSKELISGKTSCSSPMDRSAYWHPTLYMNGTAVEPERIQAYYSLNNLTKPFPEEFSYVTKVATFSENKVLWLCVGKNGEKSSTSAKKCEKDEYLMASVEFPSCWNGVDSTSSDFRSHMRYITLDGRCPSTHPIHLPQLTLFLQWSCNMVCGSKSNLTLSSGPTGTLHADFISGWSKENLNTLIKKCYDKECGLIGKDKSSIALKITN